MPERLEFNSEQEFRRKVRRRTFVSFLVFFCCMVGAYVIYNAIKTGSRDRKAIAVLREVMDANGKIFHTSYNNPALSKEFPKTSAATRARVNGNIGMQSLIDTNNYKFKVVIPSEFAPRPADTVVVSLAQLKEMPKTEVVFNFKCIEGWSQVTWWGGVRFSDFVKKFKLATHSGLTPDPKTSPDDLYRYAGLVTPDKQYYVGIDMESMMHPQTILCYELNGQPLPPNQGAPLRLIIPVKYGIKHLKRIGMLFFSDTPPPDYWADRGYDYYSGL